HYFNVVTSEHEWWYITLVVAGDVRGPQSRGQVLVTHRRLDGTYQRFVTNVEHAAIVVDTMHADLMIGGNSVTQRDGVYRIHGASGALSFDLTLTPAAGRELPPRERGAARQ